MDGACTATRRPASLKSAALKALFAGIAIGVGLASVALVAQAHLRRRLADHDVNLVRALAALDAQQGQAADVLSLPREKKAFYRSASRAHSTVNNRERSQRRRRQQSGNCDDPAECSELTGHDAALGLHAAHLTVASGQQRLVLKDEEQASSPMGGTGYVTWNASALDDDNAVYTNNASSVTDEFEWLVIPEDGVYFVYSQVTWWGRLTFERFTQRTSRSLINTVVLKTNSGTSMLLAGMTTQFHTRCNDLQECPVDSSYVSGIVHLSKDSQIAVMADSGAAICTHSDKTFMGIFLLRQELQESKK